MAFESKCNRFSIKDDIYQKFAHVFAISADGKFPITGRALLDGKRSKVIDFEVLYPDELVPIVGQYQDCPRLFEISAWGLRDTNGVIPPEDIVVTPMALQKGTNKACFSITAISGQSLRGFDYKIQFSQLKSLYEKHRATLYQRQFSKDVAMEMAKAETPTVFYMAIRIMRQQQE